MKFPNLPTASGLTGSEVVPVTQGGIDRRTTTAEIAALAVPPGATKQILYNNAGAFGAEAGFEYDPSTNTLTVSNATLTGLLLTAASGSGSAGLRVPHGAAPSAPVNGDVWTTTTGLYARINGATVGPFGAGGSGVTDGDKGDITVSGSGANWNVDNDSITYAKMQNVSATQRLIGRNTTGAGDPEEVTFSQFLDWVGSAANGDILYRTGGVWARLGIGTNGQVLTVASNLPSWAAAGGGGGLTNWAEALSTASPNNVIPVVSFTANNAATNVDVALRPKGTGGIAAQVADGTTTGGDKRGQNSVDLQTNRSAANQVAGGAYSVVLGYMSRASASGSVGIGNNAIATGLNSAVFGGESNSASTTAAVSLGGYGNIASGTFSATLGGYGNTASGSASTAIGQYALTRGIVSSFAHAGTQFAAQGDAQSFRLPLMRASTSATPVVLTSNNNSPGTNNQLLLPDSSSFVVKGLVQARQNSTGDAKSWEFTAHIKRGSGAGTVAMVAAATVTGIAADTGAAAWTLAVTADTTNGCLAVTGTGEASKSLKWTCDIYACTQVVG